MLNRRALKDEEEEDNYNMAKEDTNLLIKQNGAEAGAPSEGEQKQAKEKFPKSVFFIVGNEFCERFSYYGMRAILVIYLKNHLMFGANSATAIYHGFTMVCYFTPLLGAILADGYIGKFKTILYISVLYAIGNAVMSLTALPPPERVGPIIGLLLIGIGTGGIKPCVSAFGGDQFPPDQDKNLNRFFSVFYFAINAGSLLSMLITPVFRADVYCFGEHCYPLAFGVPAVLMVVALIVFVAGSGQYKKFPPTGNVIGKMFGCIGRALKNKCSRKSLTIKDHWLDYADDNYEVKFISEVKSVLHVLLLFLPLPLFWALFDQQGSRWTLQAELMDGSLGPLGNLKPDQIQALNALLIILLIPLFESAVYPLLDKCKIPNRPLQRMTAGMLLAAASFVIAGFLQLKLDSTIIPPLGAHQSEVRFVNAAPCEIKLTSPLLNATFATMPGSSDRLRVPSGNYTVKVTGGEGCPGLTSDVKVILPGGQAVTVVTTKQQGQLNVGQFQGKVGVAGKGFAAISFIYAIPSPSSGQLSLRATDGNYVYNLNVSTMTATKFLSVEPKTYNVYISTENGTQQKFSEVLKVKAGGVYTVIVYQDPGPPSQPLLKVLVDNEPNSLSMLLQAPQYIFVTTGEILFSITGLSFAYSQAPPTMKSVLQSAWLLTVAFGNLIMVIVAEARFFASQATEFFVFAGLMTLDTLVFAVLAFFYTYVEYKRDDFELASNSTPTESGASSPDGVAPTPSGNETLTDKEK